MAHPQPPRLNIHALRRIAVGVAHGSTRKLGSSLLHNWSGSPSRIPRISCDHGLGEADQMSVVIATGFAAKVVVDTCNLAKDLSPIDGSALRLLCRAGDRRSGKRKNKVVINNGYRAVRKVTAIRRARRAIPVGMSRNKFLRKTEIAWGRHESVRLDAENGRAISKLSVEHRFFVNRTPIENVNSSL